jgi:hypothetical protein
MLPYHADQPTLVTQLSQKRGLSIYKGGMMSKLLHFPLLCLFAVGLSYPLSSAGVPIFNNLVGENVGNNAPATVGTQFTTGAQRLIVNSLGVYDAAPTGLPLAAQVGIWLVSTQALVGSGTVPAGTAGTLIQDWRFAPVTPFTLLANTTYRIGAFDATANGGNDEPSEGTFGVGAGIVAPIGSVFHVGSFGFPEATDTTARIYANADVTAVVPEPSTLLLIGLGLAGLALRRRV